MVSKNAALYLTVIYGCSVTAHASGSKQLCRHHETTADNGTVVCIHQVANAVIIGTPISTAVYVFYFPITCCVLTKPPAGHSGTVYQESVMLKSE